MDISPKQLVSVAAALIPFLEHDDANRALMGSNMQRQAVPLLPAEAPLVGTGLEATVARDSGAVVLCQARRHRRPGRRRAHHRARRGRGSSRPATAKEFGADIYPADQVPALNQNTCINQKPIVAGGRSASSRGQVLADGPCTERGRARPRPQRPRRLHAVARLQLRGRDPGLREAGQGGLLHLDPHRGVRDRGPRHQARPRGDHARHPERLGERARATSTSRGIIRIGATVKPGDILVGKVTPKGETQLTPEEKLLRAIFGEKAGDVRDASLKCPPGIEGTSSTSRSSPARGSRRTSAPSPIEEDEIAKIEKNIQGRDPDHPRGSATRRSGTCSSARRLPRTSSTATAASSSRRAASSRRRRRSPDARSS